MVTPKARPFGHLFNPSSSAVAAILRTTKTTSTRRTAAAPQASGPRFRHLQPEPIAEPAAVTVDIKPANMAAQILAAGRKTREPAKAEAAYSDDQAGRQAAAIVAAGKRARGEI